MTKMRQAAALSPYKGNAGNVPVAQWLDATGKYIDGLKRAEDRLLSDFAATVQDVGFGSAVGILESAGALSLGLLTVTGAVAWFVVLLDHAAGRATGRDDGDAGAGQERHRGARAPSAATRSGTWRGRCWCSAMRRSRRTVWKPHPPMQQKAAEVERQRNEAAQGRRGGAGQACRRRARRRARAARQGRAHLPDHRGVRRRIQEGAGATSTRPSRSCRRPSARS